MRAIREASIALVRCRIYAPGMSNGDMMSYPVLWFLHLELIPRQNEPHILTDEI
jgi:hypothetical protein